MINRRTLLQFFAVVVGIAAANPVWAASGNKLQVVATFSILGDMVSRIGGEYIELKTLVGRNGDAHVFQPVPADAAAVREADVLIVNGLGFEGWLDRLVEASGFQGTPVVATAGIDLISLEGGHDGHDEHADEKGPADHNEKGHHNDGDQHVGKDKHDEHADHHDHGAFDPHAWQSLANAVIYADNIAAALSKADPARATSYYQNRAAFVAEIRAVDAEVRETVAALPESARTIVTSHDAFGYFAEAYGLTFVAPQGLSTESEASAADVAALIRQIRKEKIKAVFVENIGNSRLLEQIAKETGATIGGSLYSDALSDIDEAAPTYLEMMRHNLRTLASALAS